MKSTAAIKVAIDALLIPVLDKFNTDFASSLLEQGADIEQPDANTHNTLLHKFVLDGNEIAVEWLINNKANIDALNQKGNTPLLLSILKNQDSIAIKLLSNIANRLIKNNDKFDAIALTVLRGNLLKDNNTILLLLLDKEHADLPYLHIALARKDLPLLKALLEKKECDIEEKNSSGYTALHEATSQNNLKAVEILLAKGANPAAICNKKQTPLHIAAENDNLEIVNKLLEIENKAKVNINAEDIDGNTPLHLAAKLGKAQIITALLLAKADHKPRNNQWKTPAKLAIQCNKLDTAKLIEQTMRDIKRKRLDAIAILHQEISQLQQEKTQVATTWAEVKAAAETKTVERPRIAAEYNVAKATEEIAKFQTRPQQHVAPNAAQPNVTTQPTISEVNPEQLQTFLRLVAEGEQDQAEAMLKGNRKLVFCNGNVTDLSGRTFNNITGFQYAVWALDSHMWTMIQKYLSIEEEDIYEAYAQIKGLETGAWVEEYGQSASWKNLIDAFNKCIILLNQEEYSEADLHWIKAVGRAQSLLPAHVINEYCHPNRPLYPCPNFKVLTELPRSRKTNKGEWFSIIHNKGKLGNDFANWRYSFPMVVAGDGAVVGRSNEWRKLPTLDSECIAVTKLFSIRTEQRDQLLLKIIADHDNFPKNLTTTSTHDEVNSIIISLPSENEVKQIMKNKNINSAIEDIHITDEQIICAIENKLNGFVGDSFTNSGMQFALYFGRKKVVQFLISKGVSVSSHHADGSDAELWYANSTDKKNESSCLKLRKIIMNKRTGIALPNIKINRSLKDIDVAVLSNPEHQLQELNKPPRSIGYIATVEEKCTQNINGQKVNPSHQYEDYNNSKVILLPQIKQPAIIQTRTRPGDQSNGRNTYYMQLSAELVKSIVEETSLYDLVIIDDTGIPFKPEDNHEKIERGTGLFNLYLERPSNNYYIYFSPRERNKTTTCKLAKLQYKQNIHGKEINSSYQYEDNDVCAILRTRLTEIINKREYTGNPDQIQVLAAIDGMSPLALEDAIRANRANFPGEKTLLIPYNVGHYHWVGILLHFNSEGEITKAQHMDSLGCHDFNIIQDRLNAAGYNCTLEKLSLLKQHDCTSCGAYMVENLLSALQHQNIPTTGLTCAEIRSNHLCSLQSLMPDFYAAFYQRQLSNSSSIVSLNSRLGYKKQDTAKHEEVKFTSFELKKILDICDNIQGFSNKTITAQLCNAFKNLFSNAHTEHSIHLNSIRSTLSCISGELKVTNATAQDHERLAELVNLLFCKEWKIDESLTEEFMDRLWVDYEQILAVGKLAFGNFATINKQLRQDTAKQITDDKQIALKLQSQLYHEHRVLDSEAAHIETTTIPIIFSGFTPKVKTNGQDFSHFLRLVAEGEQDQAEAMLRQTPELALYPGIVADLSGRTFDNITGFQYAVWALDSHMWEMIRKYLPNAAAREQVKGLRTGLWVAQHGESASWQNLIDALDGVIKLYDQSEYAACYAKWRRDVGDAQLLLPVHVVNQYCHPNRSFKPYPDFSKEHQLPRSRQTDNGDWFTCTSNGGKLGKSCFAFYRSGGRLVSTMGVAHNWYIRYFGDAVGVDRDALVRYMTSQTQLSNQLLADINKQDQRLTM